jgi:hypothetical protein
MAQKIITVHADGSMDFTMDYKAPHANRGTSPRRHWPRAKVMRLRKWSIRWGRGGTIDKRLFA